jgi:hypothetical protein
MDDGLLRELIELQREENQLLKKYLWRFRFSLLSLLLLTTATAIGLGFLVYEQQTKTAQPAPMSFTSTWASPQGTLRLAPADSQTWTNDQPSMLELKR